MNHSEAIESFAVAGYLLGDLSETQRDAFEMHYIDCPLCAEAVLAGTKMFAAGREAEKSDERKVIPFPKRWFTARAVAAALAVVVGIQAYVISQNPPAPSLPVMDVPTQGPLLTSATRAVGGEKVVRFQGDQTVEVYADIPPEPLYPSYRLELRNSSGTVIRVATVSGEQVRNEEGRPLPFLLRPLPAGRYVLVIEGVRKDGNRVPITQPSFVVQ